MNSDCKINYVDNVVNNEVHILITSFLNGNYYITVKLLPRPKLKHLLKTFNIEKFHRPGNLYG